MNIDAPPAIKDHIDKQNNFVEVVNAEKLLWSLIHSKGLLHTDVQDLYRKACSGYENIILNDPEEVDLQDVEYCLWKFHYKHIDEYRKRLRQTSGNANLHNTIDGHMEGFKSFLSEATEFYKNLILKTRICCGFPGGPFYKDGGSFSVEPTRLHKFQYVLHRFFVCLGDLARYRELCEKTDIQNNKWSVATTYYLEATAICPDSGNPQNQLALVATYVGDDFLALYHCVRSLAVKEPFPDAWDNLMLLFEKNRSSHLHALLSEAHFDFLKPSERSCLLHKSHANGGLSNNNKLEATENISSGKADLWPLFIRMISFFFVKVSLEDFPCTFASTMREFEALLALDDANLKASLESYQHMGSTRKGPYRALQVVSILIFIIHSRAESSELKDPKEKTDTQQPTLTRFAWITTFIYMGRLLERCLKGSNHLKCSPLLGAVLIFVEWLFGILDKTEIYGHDEKVTSAISYFFGTFVDLLNEMDIKEGEIKSLPGPTALWEDYELRGFAPIVCAHVSLDFSASCERLEDYESRSEGRAHRICHATMKFAEKTNNCRKWISYDKPRRKFYSSESMKFSNQAEADMAGSRSDIDVYKEGDVCCVKGKSVVVEEEEVILFKPITRYNSVPLHTFTTTMSDEISGTGDETAPPNECLRRATSLFSEQNQVMQTRINPTNSCSDTSNIKSNKPFKQQESLLKDSATYPAGPPSLSAWVIGSKNPNTGREKETRDFGKLKLSPIEEIASSSLTGLSISDCKDSIMDSGPTLITRRDPSPYVAPMPSAPLLPEDASWFRTEANGILGPSPLRGYSHWPANPGPFVDGYPPLPGLSSSEWLYQYTNNYNLEQANNHVWPAHDRWGNPLASDRMLYFEGPQLHLGPAPPYGANENSREQLFLGYSRPRPYGCGAGPERRDEKPPLLQYLKEREWQLQRQTQLRGPPYMGN